MKRTQLKKKAKKHTQSWWRKKRVLEAKKFVRERDGNKCVRCGKDGRFYALHASHVFPEGKYHNLSADPINLKMLCYQCHMQWWHKDVLEAKDWFVQKYPERYEYLKEKSKQTEKIDWEHYAIL